ncbi:MAG: hypothetical protein WAO02_18800 [Verrucomicrobiia bacterium]
MAFRDRIVRDALIVTTALGAMFALGGSASAAFLINCKECHTVPQNGMVIINFQTTTNLGAGLYKVFQVRIVSIFKAPPRTVASAMKSHVQT